MDSFVSSVNPQAVLVIAAIAFAILLATLLVRILKANFGLILSAVALLLLLQYGFGISPAQLWGEVGHLPQDVVQLASNVDLTALTSVFSD